MIKRIILSTLALLMVSLLSISAANSEPIGSQAMTTAMANNVLPTQSEISIPIVSASISNGKVIVELPPELSGEQTITVNVGMYDLVNRDVFVGTGSFNGKFYGIGTGFFMPGGTKSGTLEFVNNTGEIYKISDYTFSGAWIDNIGRIYNEAAQNAGYTANDTAALEDEAWYQLNYEYFALEKNAHDFDTLVRMFGNGMPGQVNRIGDDNHPTMKELALYHLFSNTQFTFDEINCPINRDSFRSDTTNISVWDYMQKTEQNENLVNSIFASKEIGAEGLVLNIAAQTEDYGIGNAYNGADADYGFTLTLTRVAPPIDGGNIITPGKHEAYVIGYPDETFRADNNITRGEASLIFYRLLEDENKNQNVSKKFSDVNDEWYAQAVNYLAHIGILEGYGDNSFKPDSPPITRAEFAAIISRLNDLDEAKVNVFSDVPDEHWAAGYIGSVAQKGWITGFPDGTFRPNEGITRAQAVVLVNSVMGRKLRRGDIPTDILRLYSDLAPEYWAFSDIIEASVKHTYFKDAEEFEIWQNYSK